MAFKPRVINPKVSETGLGSGSPFSRPMGAFSTAQQRMLSDMQKKVTAQAAAKKAAPKKKAAPDPFGYQKAYKGVDKSLIKSAEAQRANANRFAKEAGNIAGDRYNIEADAARKELAGELANVDKGMNRRGMLYGGLREGARSDVQTEAAQAMAQRRAAINQETQQEKEDLSNTALESATNLRALKNEANISAYNEALQRAQEEAANSGGIFRTVGKVGGLLASRLGGK